MVTTKTGASAIPDMKHMVTVGGDWMYWSDSEVVQVVALG